MMYSRFSLLFVLLSLSVSSSSSLQDKTGQSEDGGEFIPSTDGIQNNSARGHQLELKRNQSRSLIRECAVNDDCPPWMKCVNNTNKTSSECQCRKFDFYDGIVTCDKDSGRLSVLDCNCVTYDSDTGQNHSVVAGSCFENCMHISKNKMYDGRYLQLDEVNNHMCDKSSHRGGRLCGKCLPGLSPLAYSFNITCVNCTEGNKNLWKFFLVVFAPSTVFYFVVLFFKINATSSYLHGFVIFSQAVSHPALCRLIILAIKNGNQIKLSITIRILISFFGIWNLDFFRMALPGICLDMSPLSVRALDYTIAIYPFFLTILSYILIEMHDRNFRLLVFIWKPFRCLFTLLRRHWDVRTSVIDAYATFYLLSCFKILSITFDLLIPTKAFDLSNSTNTKYVLYYDGTIDYFGPEHLPYAVPAIVMALLFVVFPTLLLLLYPFRCLQYILNHVHLRWHILHTFMDSFQGCYKDGTEPGTRDYRYFAGLYLLMRILLFIVLAFTVSSIFFPFAIFVILLSIILIINIQPHKDAVSHYNTINATFLCLLALFYSAIISSDISSLKAHYFVKGCYILIILVGITPLIYISCIFIHWIISRRKWGREFVNRVRAWWKGYEPLDDSFPDRLCNPDNYRRMDDPVNVHPEFESGGAGNGISYTG